MASTGVFHNVRLRAVVASVPSTRVGNDVFREKAGDEAVRKFEKMVGAMERRHAFHLTTRNLALDSARALREAGHWSADNVDAVIFLSQTHDMAFPATACILHGDLELPPDCMCFDMRMGCSGFVYGLVQASALVASGACRRVLLAGGDCLSQLTAEDDYSNKMLFGDAGFAAVIERTDDGRELNWRLGTDGKGAAAIAGGWGGFAKTIGGQAVTDPYLKMDGLAVYKFASTVVPPEVKAFCSAIGKPPAAFDTCCFHQANGLILKQLALFCGFPATKYIHSLKDYGNTSPASIPLTLCADRKQDLGQTLMVGFGVGLSWGIAACDLTDCMRLDVREVEDRG